MASYSRVEMTLTELRRECTPEAEAEAGTRQDAAGTAAERVANTLKQNGTREARSIRTQISYLSRMTSVRGEQNSKTWEHPRAREKQRDCFSMRE